MNDQPNDRSISPAQADFMGPCKTPFSDGQKYLLSIFVVVYFLVANLIATANLDRYKTSSFKPIVHSIAVLFGIDQIWAVFGDFRPMSYHSSAMITFGDGTQRLYEFPRFDKMSESEKFRHSKLRMIFYDFMANQKGEPFRPAIAQYIAKCNANPLNQPTFMTFYFNYYDIPAPTPSTFLERSKATNQIHRNKQPYFVYSVSPVQSSGQAGRQ
jgi:hypothetical protein